MRTSRTDKVMNLLERVQEQGKTQEKPQEQEQGQEAGQPADNEERLANPALKIPEGEYIPKIYTRTGSGTQLVNVIFLLINEQLGQIMERFHCCMCPACAQAVTVEVLRKLPPVIVTVKRKDDERQVNLTAGKYRAVVTQVVTKAVIGVKSNPAHYRDND